MIEYISKFAFVVLLQNTIQCTDMEHTQDRY